jgi:hypothetical protein
MNCYSCVLRSAVLSPQLKTGPIYNSLDFTAHKYQDVILIDGDIENNWPTTYLAIFNVILMWHRRIKKHFDAFTAVGA